MTAAKAADQASSRSSTTTTAASTGTRERKPWKKRTPVEVVLDQIDRLRDNVTQQEEKLKQAKRQLQKLEDVRKVLEGA